MIEGTGRRLRERCRDARGVTLVLVAGAAVALFSIVALAVDYGMLTAARTEAQRVADLSALAGAGILAVYADDEEGARSEAIRFAALNTIRGEAAVVEPTDVEVDLDTDRVRVTVFRTVARGNPMRTWFARVFGIDAVDVATTAVAEAADVQNFHVPCLLPLALPDRWAEADGLWDPTEDEFEPEEGDQYIPPSDGDPGTGYSTDDIGERVYMRSATGGGGDFNPSWYYPWTPAGAEADLYDENGPGGDRYRDRFTGCIFGSYGPGTVVKTEPGAMVGPTRFGFEELYDLDTTAFWDESGNGGQGCVARPDEGCVYDSQRVRTMPMFDPRFPPDAGRNEFTLTNFASVFYEGRQGNNFIGRFLGLTVAGQGSPADAGGAGPLPKAIRLIE